MEYEIQPPPTPEFCAKLLSDIIEMKARVLEISERAAAFGEKYRSEEHRAAKIQNNPIASHLIGADLGLLNARMNLEEIMNRSK